MFTEIHFLILFERDYVSLTNNVFLDDKNEANFMKIDFSEVADKLLYLRVVSPLSR